jgi:hypothetical protein
MSRQVGEEHILPKMLALYNRNKACPLTFLCQSVFKKAGIETMQKVDGNARANCVYGMHSFRHTLVSELYQKGVDLGTVQHLYTGHGSSYVTELYAHASMDQKRIDLSKLSRIDTQRKEPSKFETFVGMLNDDDKEEYDRIKTMDIPKNVSYELVGLLKFKSRNDLTTIKEWIDRRLTTLK